MASMLYRLARWAHRHHYRVIAMWLAAFIFIGVSASLFMGQLSNTFTIPGTETQRTLDRMKEELPDLAGGSGSIVFRESSGKPLNEAQKQSIADSLEQLGLHPQVVDATSPFKLQEQLDDAKPELDKAQQKLVDGQKKLDDGKKQIADGKQQLADAKQDITDGWAEYNKGQDQIAAGQPQIDAAAAQLATGRAELERAEAQLTSGQAQLDAGQKKYDAGLQEYNAGRSQYDKGLKQFQAGEKKLDAAQAKIDSGEKEYAAGMDAILQGQPRDKVEAQLAAGKTQATTGLKQAEEGLAASEAGIKQADAAIAGLTTQIDQTQKQLDQAEADNNEADIAKYTGMLEQLTAGRAKAETQKAVAVAGRDQATTGIEQAQGSLDQINAAQSGLAKLDAARKQLDAGAAELKTGQAELDKNRGKLVSAKTELTGAKSQLDAAKSELAANRAKLNSGWAELRAGKSQLAAGQAEFDQKKAEFEAGKAELAAAKTKLEEGEATVKEKTAELEQAEKDIATAEKDLESGRAELEFASRQVNSSNGMRFVSEDGSTAVAQVTFKVQTDALTTSERDMITAIAAGPQANGVEVLFSKEILQDMSSIFGAAEVIGVVIAAIVLLAMLGTLVAAGLPLLLAILGVGAGVGTTLAFSSLIDMASITPALALMLGLAVGIDYALFIIHRHRSQLLGGMDVGESIARAVGTSGNAVVFAGLTVIIALAALTVPGLPFLSVLGLSAAFTVLCSVLLNITLLPALLSLAGNRLVSKRARAKAAVEAENPTIKEPISSRWVRTVTKVAIPAVLLVVVVLGAIALPSAQMRTALPDGSAEPADSQAFQAFEQTSDKFGAGYNGPLLVLADLPEGLSQRDADTMSLDVADMLRDYDGVVAAIPVTMTEDRTLSAIQVIPTDGPSSEATEALVHQLRADYSKFHDATGATISLTGQVAAQIDVSEKVTEALVPYLAIVVGLSLILLLLVFRSVVVPVLATGGFLLSLAAAFGASVMVYQFGWMASVFDVNVPGPLLSFLPILLTGILFGLAMDYQVFLVSAMRERFAHGEPARDAVRSGFSMAAPVVTAAALIMISVFAGFVFSHLSMIRPLGFALAVGVLFDAFVVRMTLIPALMHLLGDKAWYLPKWLDKILPDVDVEGSKLNAMLEAEDNNNPHGGAAGAKEDVTV
ncbi:multidrug RND transporter [Arthrobacter sp. YC-RL1]|uniref:MMPL family transporter n=1 Tax=Arthrobacter sp. YC-RL1 TaxID=1652545 RepID=UPI00063DCBFB|nr:MMPL family transporter [Arthrobacter sp. YC-RL1]ALQ31537.1 multidrug RND transporter [Arthrobacter sp. YC-RL1]KLI89985.1 multidrug RND transporter [Arthrobacter sp. YC-RL1]